MQLFENKLWKCAKIAYLRLIRGLVEDWTPYLNYRPLFSGCTDEELLDFLGKKEEPCCGMCHSVVEHFTPHPYHASPDRWQCQNIQPHIEPKECVSPASLDKRSDGEQNPHKE